jgi:YD repeat-containing protein
LYGYAGSEQMQGAGGDDSISAGAGDDTVDGGDDDDTLRGDAGHDLLTGGAHRDSINGGDGNDRLEGGTGNDTLYGDNGNDTLDGGAGNDLLTGGAGNDTYLFGRGSGSDTISNSDSAAGRLDVVQLGPDVAPADVQLVRSGNNLAIRIPSSADVLWVTDFFYQDNYKINEIRFADGTIWDIPTMLAKVIVPTEGNDTLYGYAGSEQMQGAGGDDSISAGAGDDTVDGGDDDDTLGGDAGNDVLYGGAHRDLMRGGDGNDRLEGGTRNDSLYGDNGNDTLDGGAGNDSLVGGAGNDTYLFGRGAGSDTISNSDSTAGRLDVVQLGPDVAPADVQLVRSGNNLAIKIPSSADVLWVSDFFYQDSYKIDQIRFADGTIWDIPAMVRLSQAGSFGNDSLVGQAALADLLTGGSGNDTLQGLAGNDTLDGGSEQDLLSGDDGNDVLLGGAGNDTLAGGIGNDTLDGGTGNDSLDGGAGNDVYLFGRGAGQDTIASNDTTAGKSDVLQIAAGLRPSDIRLVRSGDHLLVSILGTADRLQVSNYFTAASYRVDLIRFADGTTWNYAAVSAAVAANATAAATTPVLSTTPGSLDSIRFQQVGNDLRIIGIGSDQASLIRGWFAQGTSRVDAYAAAGGVSLLATSAPDSVFQAATRGADQTLRVVYDTLGRVVGEVDGENRLTESVYDDAGRLSKTIRYSTAVNWPQDTTSLRLGDIRPALDAKALVTSRRYDAAGRLVEQTDGEGTVTLYSYDTVGNLVSTTRAAGTSEVRQVLARYDLQGRLTGELSAQGAALLTGGQTQEQIDAIWASHGITHTYDAAGRRTSTTDANGNRTLFFYDEEGRLTHTVNALGEVDERRYDALNQLTETRRLATRLEAGVLAGLSGGLVTAGFEAVLGAAYDASQDRIERFTYTRRGQVASTVDARGLVTDLAYNTFGDAETTTTHLDNGAAMVRSDTFDRRGLRVASAATAQGLTATTRTIVDAFGRAVVSVDALGNARQQSYDRVGRVIRTEDGAGGRRVTTWDAFDRVLTQVDALGQATRYCYDDAERSTTMTTAEGVSVKTTRTRHGQVLEVRDGRGAVTHYTYDLNGNLTRTELPLGVSSSSEFDAANRLVRSTGADGIVTTYRYDAANRVLERRVDPEGLNLTTRFDYDAMGQVIRVTDPRGTVTETTYDAAGQVLTQMVDPDRLRIETRYAYDKRGNTVRVTAPGGRVTAYVFDSFGRRTDEVVDAENLALTTHYDYDLNGNVVMSTDPSGVVTRHVYDSNDQRLFTIDGAGGVTAFAYDANGREIRETRYVHAIPVSALQNGYSVATVRSLVMASPGLDAVEARRYDRDGRLHYTVDGTGAVVEYRRDANGNVVERIAHRYVIALSAWDGHSDPAPVADIYVDQRTRTVYDALNRATHVADGTGAVTAYEYDAAGHVVRQTQHATRISQQAQPSSVTPTADDRVAVFEYDAAGRVIRSADAMGAVTEYAYDESGNLVRQTRYATPVTAGVRPIHVTPNAAADRVTHFVYDSANRNVVTVDAEGYATRTTYDPAGRVQTTTQFVNRSAVAGTVPEPHANDRNTRYDYDSAGRLTTVTDALGAQEHYTYNGRGDKLTFRNKKGSVWHYTYDAAGRVQTERSPAVQVTEVAADARGDLVESTTSTVELVTRFAYDGVGNLIARTEGETPDHRYERTTTYGYDAAGRQVTVTYPPVLVYNEAVSAILANGLDGNAARAEESRSLSTRTFYDAFGNAVANIDVGGNVSYKVYDQANRVRYSIDALRYVTEYTRDVFGDNTATTRYATALWATTLTPLGTSGVQLPRLGAIETAVTALPHTADRRIDTVYDKLGRAVLVSEPEGYTYDSKTGLSANARKLTRTAYDAFGDVIATGVLLRGDEDTGEWATTRQYHDRLGRLTDTLDALHYRTTHVYDAFGELRTTIEYATAQAPGSWSDSTPGTVASSAADRRTDFAYDALGRKVLETRVGVLASTAEQARAGISAPTDLVTRFGYDALGNLTWSQDALGGNTYSLYDALGRVTAVVAPTRVAVDGSTTTPLTLFRRDAYGNVTVKVDLAHGALGTVAEFKDVSTSEYLASIIKAQSPDDRTTLTRYDLHGHALQVTDAQGYSSYTSYNERGQVAKTWQGVVSGTPVRVDGNLVADSTVFKVFQYDALGQLTHTLDPGVATSLVTQAAPSGTASYSSGSSSSGGSSSGTSSSMVYGGAYEVVTPLLGDAVAATPTFTDTGLQYNAFGEVIRKGVNGGNQEYFDYDNAGRLWRTNAGDGVDRVVLYDRAGNATAELSSSGVAGGNFDLKTLTHAQQADAIATLRRTDTVYDAMGRVETKTGPARSGTTDGLSVQQHFTSAGVTTTANVQPQSGWSMNGVSTDNEVQLVWPDLSRLGTGEVRVDLTYTTAPVPLGDVEAGTLPTAEDPGEIAPVITRTRQLQLTAEQGALGALFSWKEHLPVFTTDAQGVRTLASVGVGEVTRVTVWKKDAAGVWQRVSDGAPGEVQTSVEVAAPQDGSNAGITLLMRPAGSGAAWQAMPVSPARYADLLSYDVASLAPGTYEYRLEAASWYLWQGPQAVSTGTFVVSGTVGDPAVSASGVVRPVVTQTTDRWGNVLSMTDPRHAGWVTTYTYNQNNQLVLERRPDGTSQAVYYDALGRQVATRDGLGHVNSERLDAGGHVIAEQHADGGVVTHAYNTFGEKVATTSAETNRPGSGVERITRFAYDKRGRLVQTEHGTVSAWTMDATMTGHEVRTRIYDTNEYDQAGRKLSQTTGAGEGGTGGDTYRYRYDLAGRVIETIQPGGDAFRLRTVYDAYGHVLGEIDQNNRVAITHADYFGLALDHSDLGGGKITYTYDNARQLVSTKNSRYTQSGIPQVHLQYEYDTAGQVRKIVDNSLKQVTEYTYDLSGRHVREKTTQDAVVYQDNLLAYDSMGRLRHVGDGRMSIDIEFDAAGNRKRLRTHAKVPVLVGTGETAMDSDRYFTYDAMNRQIGVDLNAAGQIGPQGGHLLSYDLDGNRVSDTFFGNGARYVPGTEGHYEPGMGDGEVWVEGTPATYEPVANQMVREDYAYDAMNRLSTVHRDGVELDMRGYDTTGRVIFTGPVHALPSGYAEALNSGVAQGKGIGLEYRVNFYDTNGRLRDQYVYNSDHTKLTSGVHYTDYDAAGNLLKYHVDIPGEATNTYTYTHKVMEGYKEAQIYGTSTKYESGRTLNTFDINGNLTRVSDTTRSTNSRSFVNDVQGHALYVRQYRPSVSLFGLELGGDAVQRQVVVNGEVLGRYGLGVNELDPRDDDGDPLFAQIADFNVGYQPINGNYPTAAAGTYQVRAGDTLRSIARQAYGDEGLWYRIAEGNGLSGERDLHVGQTLNIPSIVGAVHNRYDTFKPYDPSKITGDTTPNLPVPASDEGCGGLGTLLVVIVAVAVTIFTANVAAAYFMVDMAAVSAGSVAIGAASAAVGSVVSQGVAIGLDMQEEFDWEQVGMAAIGGGMGVATQAINTGFGNLADTMTRAAVANAMTQRVGVVLGMQDKFNWRAVAAAAASAGMRKQTSEWLQGSAGTSMNSARPVDTPNLQPMLTGMAGSVAAAAARGGKVTVADIAADAFGNVIGERIGTEMLAGARPYVEGWRNAGRGVSAVGNALGEGLADAMRPTQGQGPWSSADYRNGSDIDSDNFNPAMAYGYRNGADIESDAYNPAMAYGYRNGLDIESDNAYQARRDQEWIAQSDTILRRRSDAALAAMRRASAARDRQWIAQDDAITARRAAESAPVGFAGRSTITDPSAYIDPRVRMGQLSAMSNEPAENYDANTWKAAARDYKLLQGKNFSRDSIYNGLWTKGAQLDFASGGLKRDALDQAAGVGIEAGAHADMGVGLGAKAGTTLAGVLGAVKLQPVGDGPQYVAQSPIDYDHVVGADYKNGKPTGGHSLVRGDVRAVPGTESAPDAFGVYKATIKVPDPVNTGQWLTKTSNSSTNTMFPKDWSETRIKVEVDAAWNSANKVVIGDKWQSVTPSGVRVEGWVAPRTTVYPVYQAPKPPAGKP